INRNFSPASSFRLTSAAVISRTRDLASSQSFSKASECFILFPRMNGYYVIHKTCQSKISNLKSVHAQRVEQISSKFQSALLPVHRIFFQGAEYLGFDHDVHFRIERAQ